MNEANIRRLFITDQEWNRTSPSWKELKPLRNYNEFQVSDETVSGCFERLQGIGYDIPFWVIEQWIYPHYYNRHTVNNYGWIDYRNTLFIETVLSIEDLKNAYIIQDYQNHVEARSKASVFGGFMCLPKDLEYWKTYYTWRVPPIVLDITSLSNVPKYAEIGETLQLIEGHTRLGYLLAIENSADLQVRDHKVFLMRVKS